jgi:uncharacterized protein (TIGR00730 family)
MKTTDGTENPHPTDSSGNEKARIATLLHAPSYRLAFEDADYLMRDELRPNRLGLEFLKPELVLQANRIRSTIVVFGGTRVLEPVAAERRVRELEAACAAAPADSRLARDLDVARRVLAKSHYYDVARDLGRLVSQNCQDSELCDFVIVTGGGPGIMEAANRGAFDVDAKSIGFNITLPHEQAPNSFITPDLCFQFRYFAIRKMHFMVRAKALVVFPGGFGTLDELFDALTLVQTHKVEPLPVILCGREFWQRTLDLEYLAAEGTIAYHDLELFSYAETAEEIWQQIRSFHHMA